MYLHSSDVRDPASQRGSPIISMLIGEIELGLPWFPLGDPLRSAPAAGQVRPLPFSDAHRSVAIGRSRDKKSKTRDRPRDETNAASLHWSP